jgi:glutamate racemase
MGGLTVLRAIRNRLPDADLIYLGDTARLPYGTKTEETVIRYALQAASLLVERGVGMLVVACNTASSLALPSLIRSFSTIPVIGVIEPGARAALAAHRGGSIGVLATEATVTRDAYAQTIRELNPSVKVISRPAQLLVALAEEGWHATEHATLALRTYIHPLIEAGVEDLVLGCTHFPVFSPEIAQLYPQLHLIDSAVTTAAVVADHHPERGEGSLSFLITDGVERFKRVGALFWGSAIDKVSLVDL